MLCSTFFQAGKRFTNKIVRNRKGQVFDTHANMENIFEPLLLVVCFKIEVHHERQKTLVKTVALRT